MARKKKEPVLTATEREVVLKFIKGRKLNPVIVKALELSVNMTEVAKPKVDPNQLELDLETEKES